MLEAEFSVKRSVLVKVYITLIYSVVLNGCETWSLILTEERSLRMFQNRLLRRIFGLKRDEVTGEWRRLHNMELYALCHHQIFR